MYEDLNIIKSKIHEINILDQIIFVSIYIFEFHQFQVYII